MNLIDEFIFYISPEKLGSQAEYFYKGKNKINFFDNEQFDIVEETQLGKDKKIVSEKNKMDLNSTKELISEIKKGNMVLLMDDEDRENEGDLILAGEKLLPKDKFYG